MKKLLVLGILVLFLAVSLNFGQEAQPDQEENAQAQVAPPHIKLFGNGWVGYIEGPLAIPVFYSDFNVAVYVFSCVDTSRQGGFAELVYFFNESNGKYVLMFGWFRLYTPSEQGFYRDGNGKWIITDKAEDTDLKLWYKFSDRNNSILLNEDGDPIMELYLRDAFTKEPVETLTTINVREVFEKHLK